MTTLWGLAISTGTGQQSDGSRSGAFARVPAVPEVPSTRRGVIALYFLQKHTNAIQSMSDTSELPVDLMTYFKYPFSGRVVQNILNHFIIIFRVHAF